MGSRLPSVRKLAGMLDVSTPTVHAALQCLVALGFIRMAHGVGTFVSRPRDGAATLNHAWLRATPRELGTMRSAIDERAAAAAARMVRDAADAQPPAVAALSLIQLLAGERATSRFGYIETFLKADRAFHRAVVAPVRGLEVMAEIRERIDRRLEPEWLQVAGRLVLDEWLHDAHVELARAILDARPRFAASLARRIAEREVDALAGGVG